MVESIFTFVKPRKLFVTGLPVSWRRLVVEDDCADDAQKHRERILVSCLRVFIQLLRCSFE